MTGLITSASESIEDTDAENRNHSIEVTELREQISTLEELLQLYEESATEQEQRLQGMLSALREKAQQLGHAQEALQTLQSILDSMGDAVVVVDGNGQALFVNPAAKRLLSEEALDLSFQSWFQTHQIFDETGTALHCADELPLAMAIRGDFIDGTELYVVSLVSDRSQWLSVNARPITVEGSVTGAVAVFRDVTERKKFEQDLKQSHADAQQQNYLLENTLSELKQTQAKLIHGEKMASLGQTVAGIAHEINNPVNFIHGNLAHTANAFQDLLGLVRLFQAAEETEEGRGDRAQPIRQEIAEAIEEIDLDFLAADIPAMLDSMKAGTHRVREIIKSLRVFARLDEADLKTVDIHQGIDSALMIVRSQLSGHATRPDISALRELPWLALDVVFSHSQKGESPWCRE